MKFLRSVLPDNILLLAYRLTSVTCYDVKPATPSVAHEQEPQPVKPAEARLSVVPKTISIKEESSIKQPQTSEAVSSSLLEASGLDDVLSETAKPPLQQLWNIFGEKLFKQGKMALHSAMTKRKPKWSDEQAISFLVDNASLEKDFNLLKPDLMEHLRKSMGRPSLTLNIEVAKDENKIA